MIIFSALMPKLKFVGRRIAGGLRSIQNFLWGHRFLHRYLEIAIVGGPSFLLMHYYSISPIAVDVQKVMPDLAKVLDSHPIQWLIAALLWSALLHQIIRLIANMLKEDPVGWENAAGVMLQGLGSVVGKKGECINKVLVRELALEKHDAEKILHEIIQPKEQMHELMLNLHLVFGSLLRQNGNGQAPTQLRVNLAVINQGKVVSIPFHYPNDCRVRSSLEALNHSRSTIQAAIREKS